MDTQRSFAVFGITRPRLEIASGIGRHSSILVKRYPVSSGSLGRTPSTRLAGPMLRQALYTHLADCRDDAPVLAR